MIRNVMTDEEMTVLETRISNLKKEFNIRLSELWKIQDEIKKMEFELKNQKILNATFDEVSSKK